MYQKLGLQAKSQISLVLCFKNLLLLGNPKDLVLCLSLRTLCLAFSTRDLPFLNLSLNRIISPLENGKQIYKEFWFLRSKHSIKISFLYKLQSCITYPSNLREFDFSVQITGNLFHTYRRLNFVSFSLASWRFITCMKTFRRYQHDSCVRLFIQSSFFVQCPS